MMKNTLFISASVVLGFMIGYGIGQKVRSATPSHVATTYSGGVVTIKADVGGAMVQGVGDYFKSMVQ